jgi:putative prophage lambdaMc01, DNA methyltransferase
MNEIMCKGKADNIPVYCAFDKIEKIENIKPNPKNPNQHPEDQIELLSKIILAQGWRAPVTVSTLSGLVVRGHGRLLAAKHAGLSAVPVDYQHYENQDEELADLLADNKIAELSEIDTKMLADIFADIGTDSIDLTGYSQQEVQEINDALSEAVMMDIDDIKSKSEVSTHKMKIDRTVVELTDEEYDMLMSELDKYTDINGTTFGFVRWLLNDD